MTITKYDIVQDIVNVTDLTRVQANKFVDDFFEVISGELESGLEVKIAGFGNFILRDKKERAGRNPKTKESFPIAARRVVSFHTSNVLKTHIRTGKSKEEKLATVRKKIIINKTVLKDETVVSSKAVSKKSNQTKINTSKVANKIINDDVAVNE